MRLIRLDECRNLAWATAALLAWLPRSAIAGEASVVVSRVGVSFGDALRTGDHVRAWGLGDEPPTPIVLPVDLRLVELTHDSGSGLWLEIETDGQTRRIRAPAGAWELETRQTLDPADAQAVTSLMARLASAEAESALREVETQARDLEARQAVSLLWQATGMLRQAGRLDLESDALERAIVRAADLSDEALTAVLLDQLAETLVERGETTDSIAAARSGLAALGRGARAPILVARLYHRVAISLLVAGDHREARAEAHAGLRLVGGAESRSGVASALIQALAIADALEGRRLEAAEGFETVLAIRQDLGLATRSVRSNLAGIASQLGDWPRAEALYRAVLEESPGNPLQMQNLALLLERRGEHQEAARLLERAIERVRAGDGDPLTLAAALGNLARIARLGGRFAQAGVLLDEAIMIKRHAAPRSIALVEGLADLAEVRRLTGDRPSALALLDEANRILNQGFPKAGARRRLLDQRAALAAAAGDLRSAVRFGREAVALVQRVLPGSSQLAEHLHALADHLRRSGQLGEAESTLREAIRILDSQRGRLGGSGETRARFGAAYSEIYEAYRDLLLERGDDKGAFEVHERSRAQALRELLSERTLDLELTLGPDLEAHRRATAARYDAALATRDRLATRSLGADLAAAQQALAEARHGVDDLEARIRAALPRLANFVYPRSVDLEAAQATRDAGTLFLVYALGRARSTLFLLGPEADRFRTVSLATDPGDLIRHTAAVRSGFNAGASRRARRAISDHLAWLSNALLAPARDEIERAERLVVVPDSALYALPFAALPFAAPPFAAPPFAAPPFAARAAGENTQPLIATHSLSIIPSLTVAALLRARQQPKRPPRLAAFGAAPPADQEGPAPALTASALLSGDLRRRGRDLEPLPYARLEIESLASVFAGDVDTFFGAEAKESRALGTGGAASHVHFAAHALLDPVRPLDSGLVLAAGDGANGFLQAWEIIQGMRLEADLVSLSACQTALGENLRGEGILGLTTAFHLAGARAVLATLWSVSDRSSAAIMERFYRYLAAGDAKDDALARAMHDLAAAPVVVGGPAGGVTLDLRHPYHWAGYVLIGDRQ